MPRDENTLDLSAPVLCGDWPYEPGDEITGCQECLPWSAEIVVCDNGIVLVREWHAAACPTLRLILDGE